MIAAQVLSALGLVVTALYFPALRVYLGNHLYYNLSLAHVALWLALLCLVVSGVLAALALLIPHRLRRAYAALLLGLAFFAWVKASFLGWDYGMFIGDSIAWDRFATRSYADTAALVLACFASLFWRRQAFENCARLVLFLALVQSVALIALTPLASAADRTRILAKRSVEVQVPRTEKISSRENVILLLLDTLQADVVAQWFAGDQRRREAWRGFVYFRDAVSEAGVTWLSVPHLLTGAQYDNQQPYTVYLGAAYEAPGSALRNLRAAGYYVELSPWALSTPIPLSRSLLSNVAERGFGPSVESLRSILVVGLFTVLPQLAQKALHPAFLAATLEFVDANADNNLRFIRDLDRLPVEMVPQPVAKFIHLRGPHVPLLRYGAHGFDYAAAARDTGSPEVVISEFTRPNFERVSAEMLEAVTRYLQKLQAAGAYDRTTLFVFGDHGAGRLGQRFIAPATAGYGKPAEVISSGMQAAAAAALMVKPPGGSGELAASDAPVVLSDIGATLNRIAGRGEQADGSVLLAPRLAQRSRRFIDVSSIRFDGQGRLPPMTEFRIDGPVWRDASWSRTGRRFLASGMRQSDPPYAPGTTLKFGADANALDYLDQGWRAPVQGAKSLWTDGYIARMTLPLKAAMPAGGVLELDAGPYGSRFKSVTRRAVVSVNGVDIGSLAVSDRRIHRLTIPAAATSGDALALRFDLPDAMSPYGTYGHADDGLLSLQVYSLRVAGAAAP